MQSANEFYSEITCIFFRKSDKSEGYETLISSEQTDDKHKTKEAQNRKSLSKEEKLLH